MTTPLAPVFSPRADALAIAAAVRGRRSIFRGELTGPVWRPLATLPPGERAYVSRWTDDDWIYFVHWAEGDSLRWLSRVRASGGPVQLNVVLPRGCTLTPVTVSRDFRRLVCRTTTDPTSDVWLAEDFDPESR